MKRPSQYNPSRPGEEFIDTTQLNICFLPGFFEVKTDPIHGIITLYAKYDIWTGIYYELFDAIKNIREGIFIRGKNATKYFYMTNVITFPELGSTIFLFRPLYVLGVDDIKIQCQFTFKKSFSKSKVQSMKREIKEWRNPCKELNVLTGTVPNFKRL